jgi:glycylpeptide N-tetradecanoyltransferase
MSRLIKLLKLPNEPQTPGVRAMVETDVPRVTELLNAYLADGRAKFHPTFDEEEVHHWFLPREDVIYTYVVETEGIVSDVLSFYTLPSTVIGNPKHTSLKAAYSFCKLRIRDTYAHACGGRSDLAGATLRYRTVLCYTAL